MYFNIAQPLVCETVMRLHRATFWPVKLFSGSQALFMKMLITLEPCGIFGSNFVYYCILTLSTTAGMRNSDEASPSINLASQALLVKMLKILGPHGIF